MGATSASNEWPFSHWIDTSPWNTASLEAFTNSLHLQVALPIYSGTVSSHSVNNNVNKIHKVTTITTDRRSTTLGLQSLQMPTPIDSERSKSTDKPGSVDGSIRSSAIRRRWTFDSSRRTRTFTRSGKAPLPSIILSMPGGDATEFRGRYTTKVASAQSGLFLARVGSDGSD